jgi:hypothetical protein
MERLAQISQIDPNWYLTIEGFLIQNPEFGPYVYLIPIHRPTVHPSAKNFLEHLVLYICESGVNRKYAWKQWSLIQPFLQSNQYNIGLMVEKIGDQLQPKKRQIYLDLWEKVQPIGPLNYQLQDLLNTKVKGVGPGCIGQLKQFWSTDNDAVEITDRAFIAGFKKVYGDQNIKKTVDQWGNQKIVGSLLCTQIYHYLL